MPSHLIIELQGLECDFLCLVQRGSLDGLEFLHEFSLEGLVVGFGPGTVFLEGLGDGNFEIKASTADLAGDAGSGKGLELGKVLVEECLACLEAFRVTGSVGWSRGIL